MPGSTGTTHRRGAGKKRVIRRERKSYLLRQEANLLPRTKSVEDRLAPEADREKRAVRQKSLVR